MTKKIFAPIKHKSFAEFLEWTNEDFDIAVTDTFTIMTVKASAVVERNTGKSLFVALLMINEVIEAKFTIEWFEEVDIEIKYVTLNGIEWTTPTNFGYGCYDFYSSRYKRAKKT